MKIKALVQTEIEIDAVRVELPVRYRDEDIPYDFPLRVGDEWIATIDFDSGQIRDWPKQETTRRLFLKVCDEGRYYLLSGDRVVASRIENYVPHEVVPGEYGDYVELRISADGVIENWKPDVRELAQRLHDRWEAAS